MSTCPASNAPLLCRQFFSPSTQLAPFDGGTALVCRGVGNDVTSLRYATDRGLTFP